MFTTGELADVESVIAQGYIDYQGLHGIDVRGPEGFRRVVMTARGTFKDLQIDIKDLIADGNKVVARLWWYGVGPTGKKVDRETIDIVRFANGRAVEHWGVQLWVFGEQHK